MKIILLAALFVTAHVCFAQVEVFIIKYNNNFTYTYSVANITSITFDKPSSVVNSDNGIMQSRNYPNPFTNSTIIEFDTKSGIANIRIFDIYGNTVRYFDEINCKEGLNQVEWDGKNNNSESLTAGVYYYQIRNENSVISSKMILLK